MIVKIQIDDFDIGCFEITDAEAKVLSEHSIERMLNTTYNVVSESNHRDADNVLEDIRDLKRLVCGIWRATQNAIFTKVNSIKTIEKPVSPYLAGDSCMFGKSE